jgi:hypothetical protein
MVTVASGAAVNLWGKAMRPVAGAATAQGDRIWRLSPRHHGNLNGRLTLIGDAWRLE